jgi:hypothetical protein
LSFLQLGHYAPVYRSENIKENEPGPVRQALPVSPEGHISISPSYPSEIWFHLAGSPTGSQVSTLPAGFDLEFLKLIISDIFDEYFHLNY